MEEMQVNRADMEFHFFLFDADVPGLYFKEEFEDLFA